MFVHFADEFTGTLHYKGLTLCPFVDEDTNERGIDIYDRHNILLAEIVTNTSTYDLADMSDEDLNKWLKENKINFTG